MTAPKEGLLDIATSNLPLLLPALGYTLAWLAVRFVFYAILRACWRSKATGKEPKDVGLQEKIMEESYDIIGSLVAFALGLEALKYSDQGGCGLLSTRDCFSGWPSAGALRAPAVTLYHTVELGWYLHYLAKHRLGMGMQDNLAMHLHHGSTLTLLFISFTFNLHRIGVLVLFVLNLSNPFLHVAKVAHYTGARSDKLTFLLFAVTFFVSRILVFPAVVLKASLLDSVRANPAFLAADQHLPVYAIANLLLLALMVMQVQWFRGIVRLLAKALGGSQDEFTQESQAHDYAKTKDE
ncbi:hypothetical protein Agub_g15615 [Astrephomene gubernaculifera]|uniref:TLC domain-containing protein n=1 Tax=Astrephomene gubernaculifera TaxID=47775 RepID=A0AAD3E4X8_9CHLO|nr:hypothetical protein Agub_g15615 [Astrephomene gubernaculifera]